MDKNTYREKLEGLLTEQAICAQHLLATLKEEREALASRNAEALKEATDHKNLFVHELEKLESVRVKLHRLGQQKQQGSFDDLLHWCDPEQQLEQQWANLLTTVEDCKKANETNGAMLKNQAHQVDTALSILCGVSQNETLYDANGNKRQTDPGRPLAKA